MFFILLACGDIEWQKSDNSGVSMCFLIFLCLFRYVIDARWAGMRAINFWGRERANML